MKEEYPTLRTEILYWQNFRFVLLGASVALVSGIIGFGLKSPDTSDLWMSSSVLLLIFLSCAAALSCYAARGNTKIGTYLKVFHEAKSDEKTGWEGLRSEFAKGLGWYDRLNLSHWLTLAYLVLGIVSVVLPWFAAKTPWPLTCNQFLVLGGVVMLFVIALICLCFFSYPREDYERHWGDVASKSDKTSEGSTAEQSTAPNSDPLPGMAIRESRRDGHR